MTVRSRLHRSSVPKPRDDSLASPGYTAAVINNLRSRHEWMPLFTGSGGSACVGEQQRLAQEPEQAVAATEGWSVSQGQFTRKVTPV